MFAYFLALLVCFCQLCDSQTTCATVYVSIITSNQTLSGFWDGTYALTARKSYDRNIWQTGDSQSLQYMNNYWLLIGSNDETMLYGPDNDTYPPINDTTSWKHAYYSSDVTVELQCSDTFSPTIEPTKSPTAVPTPAPSISQCAILIVRDNDDSVQYLQNWWFLQEDDLDDTNRPSFNYSHSNITAKVYYDSEWKISINDRENMNMQTYSSSLHYAFVPVSEWDVFIDDDDAMNTINITFECIGTRYPSRFPTEMPSVDPTESPIEPMTPAPSKFPSFGPMIAPTATPTEYPTLSPTPEFDQVMTVIAPIALLNDDAVLTELLNGNVAFLKQTEIGSGMMNLRYFWTIDCDDQRDEYTEACEDGYVGMMFYGNGNWILQINSMNYRDQDYSKVFVVQSNARYPPQDSYDWYDLSTDRNYRLMIEFSDFFVFETSTSSLGSNNGTEKKVVEITDKTWFWLALCLLFMILCMCCIAIFYWKKLRSKSVVFEAKVEQREENNEMNPVKHSRDDDDDELDLGDVSSQMQTNSTVNPNLEMLRDGQTQVTRLNASDPNINPNLKKSVELQGTEGTNAGTNGSAMNGEEKDMYDDEKLDDDPDIVPPKDHALELMVNDDSSDNDDDEDMYDPFDFDDQQTTQFDRTASVFDM